MRLEELEEESTENLIEYIGWGKQPDYKNLAENAFIVFCKRFRDIVQRTCRIIAEKRDYDDKVADQIAEGVFAKFWKYPKYNASKCKHGDINKCVELYLYRFAERGVTDYVKNEENPFTGDEEIITEYPDINALEIPIERKAELQRKYQIIKEALGRLTPKHKIIYLTYMQYDSLLKGGKHYLPHVFLERLQKHLQLSQASIRVYKKEAFDKINEYLRIYGAK